MVIPSEAAPYPERSGVLEESCIHLFQAHPQHRWWALHWIHILQGQRYATRDARQAIRKSLFRNQFSYLIRFLLSKYSRYSWLRSSACRSRINYKVSSFECGMSMKFENVRVGCTAGPRSLHPNYSLKYLGTSLAPRFSLSRGIGRSALRHLGRVTPILCSASFSRFTIRPLLRRVFRECKR